MLDKASQLARCCARVSVAIVAAALVLVPTIMRARQHIDIRDTTRLSIKLNWQSDAPPRIGDVTPDDESGDVVVPLTLAQQPHPARVVSRVHHLDEPVVRPLFDNSPDLLRGPPALIA